MKKKLREDDDEWEYLEMTKDHSAGAERRCHRQGRSRVRDRGGVRQGPSPCNPPSVGHTSRALSSCTDSRPVTAPPKEE